MDLGLEPSRCRVVQIRIILLTCSITSLGDGLDWLIGKYDKPSRSTNTLWQPWDPRRVLYVHESIYIWLHNEKSEERGRRGKNHLSYSKSSRWARMLVAALLEVVVALHLLLLCLGIYTYLILAWSPCCCGLNTLGLRVHITRHLRTRGDESSWHSVVGQGWQWVSFPSMTLCLKHEGIQVPPKPFETCSKAGWMDGRTTTTATSTVLLALTLPVVPLVPPPTKPGLRIGSPQFLSILKGKRERENAREGELNLLWLHSSFPSHLFSLSSWYISLVLSILRTLAKRGSRGKILDGRGRELLWAQIWQWLTDLYWQFHLVGCPLQCEARSKNRTISNKNNSRKCMTCLASWNCVGASFLLLKSE